MAMAISASQSDSPMGEMNTTPLIDVMLVLLIMFIITLPLQTHAVNIDLPAEGPPEVIKPLQNNVQVTAEGAVLWNGNAVSFATLATQLERTRALSPQPELRFEPEPQARYALVDSTLAVIKRSGVGGFGFVGNERYARDF
jgi:biopolymer transport protein ExbD